MNYGHNKKFGLLKFPSGYGKFYLNLLVLQVARLQKNVLRALSQEIVGGQDVQEAISKLESDLLDITMVTLHLYLKLSAK